VRLFLFIFIYLVSSCCSTGFVTFDKTAAADRAIGEVNSQLDCLNSYGSKSESVLDVC
jgi:hypothetical protein